MYEYLYAYLLRWSLSSRCGPSIDRVVLSSRMRNFFFQNVVGYHRFGIDPGDPRFWARRVSPSKTFRFVRVLFSRSTIFPFAPHAPDAPFAAGGHAARFIRRSMTDVDTFRLLHAAQKVVGWFRERTLHCLVRITPDLAKWRNHTNRIRAAKRRVQKEAYFPKVDLSIGRGPPANKSRRFRFLVPPPLLYSKCRSHFYWIIFREQKPRYLYGGNVFLFKSTCIQTIRFHSLDSRVAQFCRTKSTGTIISFHARPQFNFFVLDGVNIRRTHREKTLNHWFLSYVEYLCSMMII